MKICVGCGSIFQDNPTSCTFCKGEDLRTLTSMKISMGKFEGRYETSEEEKRFLKLLGGIELVKNGDQKLLTAIRRKK